MAKLFGEFLIDQRLATTEQVLEAVITQLRSVQSIAEIIFDHNLLSPTDQLRILAHQQYKGVDFRSSAAALNIWTQELAGKVDAIVLAKRRPIGEILVELGSMSNESLALALDSYVEASTSRPAPSKIGTPSQQHLAIKSFKKPLNPMQTREFVNNFEAVICPALASAVQNCEGASTAKHTLSSTLQSALSEFSALRDTSSFMSPSRTGDIAKELIVTIECVQAFIDGEHDSDIDVSILRDLFKISMHIFGGVCQLLTDFNSEDGFEADPNLIDLTHRLAKVQERLRAQCTAAPRLI